MSASTSLRRYLDQPDVKEGVDAEFVAKVCAAADRLNVWAVLQRDWQKTAFRELHEIGFDRARDRLTRRLRDLQGIRLPSPDHLWHSAITRPLCEALFKEAFPQWGSLCLDECTSFDDFDVGLNRRTRKRLHLRFTCLRKIRIRGKPHFLPAKDVKLKLAEGDVKLAYRPHVVKRVMDRVQHDWTTHVGWGEGFAIIDRNRPTRTVTLQTSRGQEPAVILYDECAPGYLSGELPRLFLQEIRNGDAYFYRVGYCTLTVQQSGGELYAVGKTLYFPGHKGTPEFNVLTRSLAASQLLEAERVLVRMSIRNVVEELRSMPGAQIPHELEEVFGECLPAEIRVEDTESLRLLKMCQDAGAPLVERVRPFPLVDHGLRH